MSGAPTVEMNIPETRPRGKVPLALWNLLYAARRAKGLNQTEAGAIFGVTQSTFSDWERLKHPPARNHWAALAAFMGISNAEFAQQMVDFF